MFGSGCSPADLVCRNTTLIIPNEEINIMKIVKSLEEFGLLIKGISSTIRNKAKEQKGRFLGMIMIIGTLGASLLGSLLTNKGRIRANVGTVRAGQDF